MTQKITIDATIDVACPFCLTGDLNLEKAIKSFQKSNPEIEVEVKTHPFLLAPDAPDEPVDKDQYLAKKFGWDRLPMIKRMQKERLAEFGFVAPEKSLASSSVPALRAILKSSANPSAQFQLALDLLKAHHVDGEAPSNKDILIDLTTKYKIFASESEAKAFFESNELEKEVRILDQQVKRTGVSGVPNYIINGREVVSGAREPQVFMQVFNKYAK